MKAIDILRDKGWKIADSNIYDALCRVTEMTGLMGRWQVIGNNPLVVCDTAHNADGISEVVKQIIQTPHKKLHIVFGMVSDKDHVQILSLLPEDADYYFTKAEIPRAMDEKKLQSLASVYGLKGKSYPTVAGAYKAARGNAGREDFIFIGGSTFVVAEIL